MHIHTASGTEDIYHDTSSQVATCLKCNIVTVLLNLVSLHTKKKKKVIKHYKYLFFFFFTKAIYDIKIHSQCHI